MGVYLKTLLAVVIVTFADWLLHRMAWWHMPEGPLEIFYGVFGVVYAIIVGFAMYEGSQQAQFLKPTVITLVYGLGFGMLLVLLLVPALLAILNDLSRPMTAMRRAARAPDRVVQGALACTGLAMLIWFGLTMVWPAVYGAPIGAMSGLYAAEDGIAILQMGLGAFLAGAAVILVLSVTVSGLVYSRLKGSTT